jgi:hypothetical protein
MGQSGTLRFSERAPGHTGSGLWSYRSHIVGMLGFVLGCALLPNPSRAQGVPQAAAAQTVIEKPTTTTQIPATATPKQRAWVQATPEQRNIIANELGDEGAREFARSRGWKPLFDGTKKSLPQGLDQVYAGQNGEVHAVEAKGGGSPLGRGYGHEQGTPEWAVKAAKRTIESAKASPEQKSAAEAVLRAAKEKMLKVEVIRTKHVQGEPFAAILERSLSTTDDAAKLAASALDDLVRAGKVIPEVRSTVSTAETLASSADDTAKAVKSTTKLAGKLTRGIAVLGVVADVGVRASEGVAIEDRFSRGEIDQKGREVEHAKNVAGMAGGWGGALAGAKLGVIGGGAAGAACGGVGAPIGATLGGLVGGAAGYFGGEAAAEATAEWTVCQVHAAGTTIAASADRAWTFTQDAAGTASRYVWRVTGW